MGNYSHRHRVIVKNEENQNYGHINVFALLSYQAPRLHRLSENNCTRSGKFNPYSTQFLGTTCTLISYALTSSPIVAYGKAYFLSLLEKVLIAAWLERGGEAKMFCQFQVNISDERLSHRKRKTSNKGCSLPWCLSF